MSTDSRMAQASDRLSRLNGRREAWHMIRFDCVKQSRQLKALREDLKLFNRLTPQFDRAIDTLEELCKDERSQAWDEIQKLDAEIDTLNHQMNNGVYDEIR